MADMEKVIRLIEEEISVCESVDQCYRTIDLPALRDILAVIKEQDQMYYTLEHDWRMYRKLLKEQETELQKGRYYSDVFDIGYKAGKESIVRCKDCIHGEDNNVGEVVCELYMDNGRYHPINWFCADGERK